MNNKVKTIAIIAGFALLIAGAVFGYNYLTQNYKAPNSLNLQSPRPTATQSPVAQTEAPTPVEGDESEGEDEGDADTDTDTNEDLNKYIDFSVKDYDGNNVRLSDYIGTPIVLNFWASWCPPCKEEMPDFNKVSEEYPREELLFLMVNLADGNRETVEKGKKHVEDNGFSFTVLFDTEQEAAMAYGIYSIPTTYFINKDGYLVAGAEGMIDEETLRRGVSLILE